MLSKYDRLQDKIMYPLLAGWLPWGLGCRVGFWSDDVSVCICLYVCVCTHVGKALCS